MTPIQTTDQLSSAAAFVAHEVERFPAEVRALPVAPDVAPAEIRAYLTERFSFADPKPLDAILADVAAMMRRWTLHATHPRYFGLFNPDVHEAGVWGDALAALYNPQVGGWWHAPAACEIERHTLHFFARAMRWDVDAMTAQDGRHHRGRRDRPAARARVAGATRRAVVPRRRRVGWERARVTIVRCPPRRHRAGRFGDLGRAQVALGSAGSRDVLLQASRAAAADVRRRYGLRASLSLIYI